MHNLFHFLALRLDDHAQKEIRVYAEVMADMVKAVCPVAFEAFMDYRVNAFSFSGTEVNVLKEQLDGFLPEIEELEKKGLSKREAREFRRKLKKIAKL